MEPELKNSKLIDKLLEKSDAFAQNIVFYFERDSLLLRKHFKNESIPRLFSFENEQNEEDKHPHYDRFDVYPQRTSSIGSYDKDWDFKLTDFMLDYIRGWFMAIRDVENKGNMIWFFYMNLHFYFFDEVNDTLKSSMQSGIVATKGKILTFRDEFCRLTKYTALLVPSFTEFEEYLDNCYKHKSLHPLDCFIQSFKAFGKYPKVTEKLLSFYRFFFSCPTFLFIMTMDNVKTPTQQNIIDVWIKAADTKIISITKLWFFTHFQNHSSENCFPDPDCLFFNVLRHILEQNENFVEFKKQIGENNNKEILIKYDFDPFIKYLFHIVYTTAKNCDYNEKQLTTAFYKFIFNVLLKQEFDLSEYLAFDMQEYTTKYETEPELSLLIKDLIDVEDVNLLINEITQNIDYYEKIFRSSNALRKIENYYNFLHPKKTRPRVPSDMTFKLEANPAIRRRGPPVEVSEAASRTTGMRASFNVPPVIVRRRLSKDLNNLLGEDDEKTEKSEDTSTDHKKTDNECVQDSNNNEKDNVNESTKEENSNQNEKQQENETQNLDSQKKECDSQEKDQNNAANANNHKEIETNKEENEKIQPPAEEAVDEKEDEPEKRRDFYSAPNYTGDEEPPLEPHDHSDPTIQDDGEVE